LAICTSSNGNEALCKVSSLSDHEGREVSKSYFILSTLLGSTITKINSTLPFWQYAHLQMTMKHCTYFQVSLISHLGGDVNTAFCDRQTDGLRDRQKVQKQYISSKKKET
jgi:hypothetical protein